MKKRSYKIALVSVIGILMAFIPSQNISLDELMGMSKPVLEGVNFKLRPEAAQAFIEMQKAAQNDGITMYSLSSYRGYDHQLRIYNRKWERYKNQGLTGVGIINKIIEYSTIPGTSRHHWGTDLDVIDASINVNGDKLLPKNYENGGVYEKLGGWIILNAHVYGFYLVYTDNTTRKGFKYEPWHLSYRKLSKPMLKQFLGDDWKSKLQNINGYEYMNVEFLEDYSKENMQDINPDLL